MLIAVPSNRKRIKPYTKIPSVTIRNPNLSGRALGYLVMILDLPSDWTVRAETLAAHRKEGRDAVAGALRELAREGLYRVERRRMLNGQFSMGTAIADEKVPAWQEEYKEFGGKPIPLVQQPDGSFLVRRKDGTLRSDGFEFEQYPSPRNAFTTREITGEPEYDIEVPGNAVEYDGPDNEDITGHGFSGPDNPTTGPRPAISTTEKYGREAKEGTSLPAEGGSRAVTRGGTPTAESEDPHLSRPPASSADGEGQQPHREQGGADASPSRGPSAPPGPPPELPMDMRDPSAPQLDPGPREALWGRAKDLLTSKAWHTFSRLGDRYRLGLPPRLRFPMVAILKNALREGYGPDCVIRYAEIAGKDSNYGSDKHIPLLEVAIRMMRADVGNGLACLQCGTDPNDPLGPPCILCRGALTCPECGTDPRNQFGPPCTTCRPDALSENMSEEDLASLAATYAHLGVTADELGHFDDEDAEGGGDSREADLDDEQGEAPR